MMAFVDPHGAHPASRFLNKRNSRPTRPLRRETPAAQATTPSDRVIGHAPLFESLIERKRAHFAQDKQIMVVNGVRRTHGRVDVNVLWSL
ncbi:MAG: hypothetical protein HN348_15665 [Proteobacteria bacterium]|nr:hypothetical protein [Pseudomonadota bacterium]